MDARLPTSRSQGNLVVERVRIPKSRSYAFDGNESPLQQRQPMPRQSAVTGQSAEPPSPRPSLDSYSPNGYYADKSVSEVSSVTGSVGSYGNNKLYSRYNAVESGDSGNYSARQNRYMSSAASYSTETDLDSVVSSRYGGNNDKERFQGELFQPQQQPHPAPRSGIDQRQTKQMFGEVHPRNLPQEELPTPSTCSGDELETASEFSVPSFADAPRVRPRASIRRKKSEANSAFVSDDELSSVTSAAADRPKGILKNASTDISDAESLAKSNFTRSNSRRSVRFEHRDKAKDLPRKTQSYSDDPEETKKKKKSNPTDPFAVVTAIGIKPARNDPKRSSNRSNSSQKGKKARSSSSDRSRPKTRNGSVSGRSRSESTGKSGSGRDRSGDRKGSRDRSVSPHKKNGSVSVRGEDVTIEMPETKKKTEKSIMGEIVSQPNPQQKRDREKICKWCLIIGVPLVILIIVIAIVVALLVR